MSDRFTLRSRSIRVWLGVVVACSIAVVSLFPPSIWLSVAGVGLIVAALLANSARTGQWWSWQTEGSLNWFEGWAASTGAILVCVPLLAILLRAWGQ